MKKLFTSVLLLVGIGMNFALRAQTTSATFDAALAAKLQAAIDDAVAFSGVRGVSVAVKVPGQGTFIGVGGESSDGVPVTPDMQFGIGSNSKLFTAVVLLRMQEDGLLSLDDPLSMWLPTFQYVDPSITIRQLLHHQSGIFDFEQELYPTGNGYEAMNPFVYGPLGPDTFYTPEDVLAMIGPAHFDPGTAYSYSNTNYLIAAMVAEAASGKSFTENLHDYILDPLNMDSTFLAAYETPNGNVANGWHLGDDLGNVPQTSSNSMYLGSGSIFSTANEMVNWYDHLFRIRDVLNENSMAQLLTFDAATWYSFGLQLSYAPFVDPDMDVWTHGGWVPGYSSVAGIDGKPHIAITVLCNDENSGSVLFPVAFEVYTDYPRQEDDASITSINSPWSNDCGTSFTPEVTLLNYGSANLISAAIHYQIDDGSVSTFNWTGSLLTDETVNVSLPEISVSRGTHTFTAFTSNPNGETEGYLWNDTAQSHFAADENPTELLSEGFEGEEFPPAGWLNGKDASMNWGRSSLSLFDGNGCAARNNYDDGTYRTYDLELPVLDVSSLKNPVMSFYYAYAIWPGAFDSLAVLASSDCGETYQPLFYKGGDELATAPPLYPPYYPADNEWKQVNLDLSSFSGEVRIKFRDIDAFSQLIYLDDVKVGEGCATPTDLSELKVTTTSAKLHWKYNGQSSISHVYYEVSGSGVWSSIDVAGQKRNAVLTGLEPGTEYNYFVAVDCDLGRSPQSPSSSFTTLSQREGADEIFGDLTVSVFPNPTSSTATVEIELDEEEDVQLSVIDVTGRAMDQWNFDEISGTFSQQIDVSKFPSGIYFIEVKTDDEMLMQKLIVQ